jgi:putative flippase GtrA
VSEKTRVATFLLTGGIAAGVNIAARWLLQFAIGFEAAVACAYLAGMVTAFVLARLFVFQAATGRAHWQFVRFAAVNLVALAQVLLVSIGLARFVFPMFGVAWLGETAAHVIGVLSPVALSYLLHKHFSFRGAVSRARLTAGPVTGED